MKKKEIIVTNHAQKRMKQRCGICKKSCQRMAWIAYENGMLHSETTGDLNKWVTKEYFKYGKANSIRLYGDNAYLFHNTVLITVIKIPIELIGEVKKSERVRIHKPS